MSNEVTVKRDKKGFGFIAVDKENNQVGISCNEASGMSPVNLLLSALASCSAYDVVLMLEKNGQTIEHIEVEVKGNRQQEDENRPFQKIDLIFYVKGPFEEQKVRRVIDLSVRKYCSVGATLRPETKITYKLVFTNTLHNMGISSNRV